MKSRAFTLRLTTEETVALEALKLIGKEKTDSKIIRYVILTFKSILDQLSIERNKNNRLTQELSDLKEKIRSFNAALYDLKKIK